MKLPIPNDWDGLGWCSWSICWPDSPAWEAFLMGLITLPMRGRTWDERTGSVKDVQAIGRTIADENLPLWGCIVSCRDDTSLLALGQQIRAGLEAIANRPCCNDQIILNINQGTDGEGQPIYGTQPGQEQEQVDIGDPPEGWGTWEEFLAYKCKAANWVVDNLADFYRNISALQIAGLLVTSLALAAALGGLITFIPPAALPLLVAGIIGLGIGIGVAHEIGDYIAENRQDLVCALYNARSANLAIEAFRAFIDDALLALVVAPGVSSFIRQIALAVGTSDLFNTLFTDTLNANYPDADCSGCGEECVDELAEFYDSETNGFEEVEGSCVDNASGDTSVTPTVGGLNLQASASSGERIVFIGREEPGWAIGTATQIRLKYINNPSLTTRIMIILETDAGCRSDYHDHGAGSFEHTYDFSAFEGERVQRMSIRVGTNGGNPNVTIEELEIICVGE